jgi:purine-binding chemotaxis protein CheW
MAGILKQQRSLGSLLVERGLLSATQLDLALQHQKKSGEKLGKILVKLGFVRQRDILAVMEGMMAVVFNVCGEPFAVESLLVREIIRYKPAIPLPQAPKWMDGLIHYRSHVVPVLNLRARLGLPAGDLDDRARIIIFEEPNRQVGVLVDEVGSVTQISHEQLEDAPQGQMGIPAALIYALARIDGMVVTLLNFEALLDYSDSLKVSLGPNKIVMDRP